MGATASAKRSDSPPEACEMTSKAVDTPAVLPDASDASLRQVLRSLQLSPDLIDKSTAAIYAHVRDPVEHPVDKELARLCTSDYTRGALHALCLYLVAVSSESDGNGNGRNPRKSALGAVDKTTPSTGAGGTYSSSDKVEQVDSSSGTALAESVSGKLSNFWNRMRRTRSMPSKGVVLPTEEGVDGDKDEDCFPNQQGPPSAAGTRPKLSVRIAGAPKSPGRANNLFAGLGLGSPSGRAAGEVATPRRAPVRTGHWKLGHEIGKGSFGAVHIGLNEDTGDLIAVKKLSLRNADQAEELYTEIELMRQLTHPNIVCYLGAEVNDSEKTISIFQEWVPGSVTTLLVNFGPFTDRRIAGYTKQILQGLVYLHSERVIHRDIKGGNILIDDRGVVKLCDFGASKLLDAESFTGLGDHTRVGSPLFMAPEILLREDYGPQVDIWSLGGAVLEMATGQPPWHTLNLRTPVALINWVKRTEGPPPLPEGLSQPLTKFLLRCFERDPTKRASAKELLSDPFVSKRVVPPKGSSPASDGDSAVSDIDNLSRTDAIARIRRASISDYSRPNSDQSTRSAPSLHTPDFPMGPRPTAVGVGVGVGAGGPPATGGGKGGAEFLTDLAQQVVAKMNDALTAEDGESPPRRPVSLRARMTPPPRVETAGLQEQRASRVTTPPTARRLSMGRASPGTPNPFSGRRRSLDTSPDGARNSTSPRVSPRASPRAGGVPSVVLSSSSGSHQAEGDHGKGVEGDDGGAVENAARAETPRAVTGAHASAGDDAPTPVDTKSDSGGGGGSSSSSSSSSRRPNPHTESGRSQGEEKVAGGDPPAPVAAPVSDNVSPVIAVVEEAEVPVRRDSLGKKKSGRGIRPGGSAPDGTDATDWQLENQ